MMNAGPRGSAVAPALVAIVGPTASGKSDLALALARRMPVEILVADSRQAYRGMDIGTAKPDAVAQAAVPHHMLDLVEPDEAFTVAQWVARARQLVPEIAGRGNLPMVVGGTGLYVSALIDGHEYGSQAQAPELRQRLADELETEGLATLAGRLLNRDPDTAARTDLRNPRRVLRALERLESGGPVPTREPYAGRLALIGLSRPRAVLYRRIDQRARQLFEEGGLLDEVRRLLDAGFGPALHPMTGHGYGEAARHLAGEWSLEQTIEVTARRTRQYAKRQLTWFRRDTRILWVPAGELPANVPELVARVERVVRAALS